MESCSNVRQNKTVKTRGSEISTINNICSNSEPKKNYQMNETNLISLTDVAF